MRLQLPQTFKDITISQIMQHGSRELDDVQTLNVYGGYSVMEVLDMPALLVQEGAKHIRSILANPEQKFSRILDVDGKLYGFITDWSEFKTKEYLDIMEYQRDTTANASKIMAVLYRPITRQVGTYYEIEPYNGTKNHEVFYPISAAQYYGVLVFFSHILSSYTTTSQRSWVGRVIATASRTSGDGIMRLWTWLDKILRRLTRSSSTR